MQLGTALSHAVQSQNFCVVKDMIQNKEKLQLDVSDVLTENDLQNVNEEYDMYDQCIELLSELSDNLNDVSIMNETGSVLLQYAQNIRFPSETRFLRKNKLFPDLMIPLSDIVHRALDADNAKVIEWLVIKWLLKLSVDWESIKSEDNAHGDTRWHNSFDLDWQKIWTHKHPIKGAPLNRAVSKKRTSLLKILMQSDCLRNVFTKFLDKQLRHENYEMIGFFLRRQYHITFT